MSKENQSKYIGYKPCVDILGYYHAHGEYFTPPSATCNQCQCSNGEAKNCIAVQCQKPKCKNYKQIPGKCCDYTCPSDGITETKTLAVVITLSVILLIIMVAIVIVWRRMRRKKKYGKRLETISTSSTQHETILTDSIKPKSISNNFHHHPQDVTSLQSITSPSLSSPSYSAIPTLSDTACSSSKIDCSIGDEKNCSSKNSLSRTDELKSNSFLPQHEIVACCQNDVCCKHTTRRFEPPPPYSPPKNLTFV